MTTTTKLKKIGRTTKQTASATIVLSPSADLAEQKYIADQKLRQQLEAKNRQEAINFQALQSSVLARFFNDKTPEEIEAHLLATGEGDPITSLSILTGNRLRQARDAAGISRSDLIRILAPEVYDRHSPYLETYPGINISDVLCKSIFLRLMANSIDALYIVLGVRLTQEQLQQAKKAALIRIQIDDFAGRDTR